MSYLICFIIAAVDQLIKILISNSFFSGQSIPVIENIFHLTYVKNTGAAFGIFAGKNIFFIIFAIIILLIIFIYIYSTGSENFWFQLAIGFIMGGAIGNLLDRIRIGYVIDYLDFRIWPVFNLADVAIVTGALLIIFLLLRGEDI